MTGRAIIRWILAGPGNVRRQIASWIIKPCRSKGKTGESQQKAVTHGVEPEYGPVLGLHFCQVRYLKTTVPHHHPPGWVVIDNTLPAPLVSNVWLSPSRQCALAENCSKIHDTMYFFSTENHFFMLFQQSEFVTCPKRGTYRSWNGLEPITDIGMQETQLTSIFSSRNVMLGRTLTVTFGPALSRSSIWT